MTEQQGSRFGEDVINNIASKTGLLPDQIRTIISELEQDGFNMAQIYEEFMHGEGAPSTHISGKHEGALKEGHKGAHKRQSRRHSKRIHPW